MAATIMIREAQCETKEALLERMGRVLGFPEYYGKNLDALYDCLTEMSEPARIIYESSSQETNEDYEVVINVIRDAADNNDMICLEMI